MAQEYNAYFKNCATCEFLVGSRTIQTPYCQRLYVASSAEKRAMFEQGKRVYEQRSKTSANVLSEV